MNPKDTKDSMPPPAGLALSDIYYIIFRHKWLVGGAFIIGALAALIVYASAPKTYESEAKLMVHYVLDKNSPRVHDHDSTVKDPDAAGASVINNELQILTSYKLAEEVASNVGPKEILAKLSGGTDLSAATAAVQRGLLASGIRNSEVIDIVFEHPDQTILQPVLAKVIQSYLKIHKDIHNPVDEYQTFLQTQVDSLKVRLNEIDDQLKKAKDDAGIISLEDSKKDLADQIAKIHQEQNEAQENLAERQAQLTWLESLVKPSKSPALAANSPSTNVASVSTNASPASFKAPTPEQVAEYQKLHDLLESYRKKELDLRAEFSDRSIRVLNIQKNIADARARIAKLESEAPDLVSVKPIPAAPGAPASVSDPLAGLKAQMQTEVGNIILLQAKIGALNRQWEQAQNQASNLAALEAPIADLTRKKLAAETDYQYYSTSLEQTGVEQMLASGKMSGIRLIDGPTPPAAHVSKVLKTAAGILFACIGLGLGLAFAIEMYLDRSVRHPKEIQARLGVPCFLSIPWMNGKGHGKALLKDIEAKGLLSNGHGGAAPQAGLPVPATETPAQPRFTLAKTDSRLQVFYETLRDRLVAYFEANNLTHKPKLVAVTACHGNAGTTHTATGLAAALSEIGEGNVLLVDMNDHNGQAHHFYKGELTCGIDDALQKEKRSEAMVQENLYVARELPPRERLSRQMPKRFSNLLPVMKASDYDYIIFDMPPVSQISITPRLAGFMDMVLLVVESGKTDREAAAQAVGALSGAKANVGVVLNKKKSYVPSRLLPEM